MSAKERLLLWTQQATEGYAGIRCENFTTCWRDGKLFNAIIHKYRYGIYGIFSFSFVISKFYNNLLLLQRQYMYRQKIRKYRQVKVKTSHSNHTGDLPSKLRAHTQARAAIVCLRIVLVI